MKQLIFLTYFFILLPISLLAQISIDECYQKTLANYPQVKQYDLIERTANYNLSNVAKAYLPQISLSGRATYQSDVTEIPLDFSQLQALGLNIPEIPTPNKDQYQVVLDVNQTIWDGGIASAQRRGTRAASEVEKQKLEVDLYALKERINQLFFGILMLNEQLAQNDILQNELNINYKRISAYIENGIANRSDLDAVRIEQINARQQKTQIEAARKSYLQMLSAFTNEKIDENTALQKPVLPATEISHTIARPEIKLFDAQTQMFDSQRSAILAGAMPRFGLFAQGGYGNPGLNMLNDKFDFYYIAGIRMSWNFSALYTQKNDLNKIVLNKKNVDVQRETFLFNNNLQNRQQQNEIARLKELIKNDDELISLRQNIKKSAEAKVANGTMTVSDLLRAINAENLARQTKSLNEIKLYLAVYQNKITNGE
ncbi:MAG: TolC family protein [Paludibacter sp.]|jgi:outer membrane protein TolC|nr:TolC family protein [Paludibacter sp.]